MIFQGNLYAKFYFISGIIFLIFVGSSVMSNFNLIPRSTFTMYGFIVNFSTEVIFFSLALGIRLQMIKNEKVEIERKSGEFKEKLNSIQMEIETASRIHRTILPSETPNIEGLDIYAVYIPSNTIGGDYYDFHQKDNKLGVFIADVTGHGIPASLFASSVKYCFSKGIKYFIEPNRLLSYMNSSLYQKLGNQLLTASFILIDPATKPAQKIQAARVLGQVTEVAAFTEVKQITHVNGSDEIKAQIMNQLKGLMLSAGQSGDVVDVTANELLEELASTGDDLAESGPHYTPTDPTANDAEPAPIHTIPPKVSPNSVESEINSLQSDLSADIGTHPHVFQNGDGEGGI
jgi:hypothetical protein